MDLESVMSIYAPDIVSFHIVAPLGAEAKRKNWGAVPLDPGTGKSIAESRALMLVALTRRHLES
jgi:hypothetical protein